MPKPLTGSIIRFSNKVLSNLEVIAGLKFKSSAISEISNRCIFIIHFNDVLNGKYYPNAPQIPYWLIDNEQFIGPFNFRTELNEFLMYIGGNVGYGITPKYRRMGYATNGLKLLISKAQKLGMKKLLIAAKEDNIGSWKAIEKNDGVLENIITLPRENTGQKYKRYWISVYK